LLQQAQSLRPAARGLLISAYSESAALATTLDLSNVRGYIPKPWAADDLRRQIGAAAAEYVAPKV
jgi:two-component SAPR family response regulator